MTDYRCKYCGKEFKYLSHFTRHENAKRKCAPTFEKREGAPAGTHVCKFCGQGFANETHMYRHCRSTCKIAPNPRNGNAGMERLYEHALQKQMNEMRAQNAQQGAQITEILGLLRQQGGSAASSTTLQAGEFALQGNQNQVDNSKKIVINVFGKEGLGHVAREEIKTILDQVRQRPGLTETPYDPAALSAAVDEAVLKTAMLVFSDPTHPENLTAYLPNKKTKDALVHTEAGWEVQPTKLVLPPMAQKTIDTLFDKQPYENAEAYGPLLKELQQNEARFAAGEDLHPILVRNKDLLARALATLPVAGE